MMLIDRSSEFGQRAERRLQDEKLAWLTTVDRAGTPQPVPVWFLWDGAETILIYSRPDTPKLRSIERNPRVSLHLDGNGLGGDIVVATGQAAVSDDPPAHELPAYLDKYTLLIERNRWTPPQFADDVLGADQDQRLAGPRALSCWAAASLSSQIRHRQVTISGLRWLHGDHEGGNSVGQSGDPRRGGGAAACAG